MEKYKLTVAGLSKQKALDDDSRTVQQIILTAKIKATEDNTRVIIYYIFEKSKERALQFSYNRRQYKSNNLLHFRKIKRKSTTIFLKHNKNVVTTYKW